MGLFKYQEDALERVEGKRDCAFYHDMGLGKTFTGAEKLMRDHCWARALVVCQKSKVCDWVSHFKVNYPEADTLDLTSKAGGEAFLTEEGDCVVGVINYDLIWRRPELLRLTCFSVMFDESSLLQNPQSKRTKTAMRLAGRANSVILLSGTPTDGKYERLWTQLNMLGWHIDERLFWRQYVDTEVDMSEGFPITKVVGYKNEERLVRKMKEHGCDFLKTEDVLELPEQNFIRVQVPATPEYRRFKRDHIVKAFGQEFVGDTTFGFMTAARMLAGAYSKPKLKAFADLIDGTSRRVVVFYNFKTELDLLEQVLCQRERPYSVVNGDSHDLKAFSANTDGIVLVQYQAGAMGLNLQAATICVYYTPPLASSLFEQSKKRIHRVGQHEACTYYELVSTGTIEEQVYQTLAKRQDYTEKLFEMGR